MAGNASPIFSRVGALTGFSTILTTQAADYTGLSPFNGAVFKADNTNGGFIQRLRFKPLGTNITTVARIFINNGNTSHSASLLTTPAAPTFTLLQTGAGTLLGGAYYARIVAVDANGGLSTVGAESAVATITAGTAAGTITWNWTAIPGAVSYRVYVGMTTTGQQAGYFTTSTNSFVQTVMPEGAGWTDGFPTTTNNMFYGELSLPATTLSANSALIDIDYPMNFALPPGGEVYAGLGTTVAAGWAVTAIAGAY